MGSNHTLALIVRYKMYKHWATPYMDGPIVEGPSLSYIGQTHIHKLIVPTFVLLQYITQQIYKKLL